MTWRLHRSLVLTFAIVSLVLITYATFNGLHIEALRHQWLATPCHGGNGIPAKYLNSCEVRFYQYSRAIGSGVYVHWIAVLPTAVFGLLLGANTVASEVSLKTSRLAWTQSITRGRWFVRKVAVELVLLAVLTIPLCLTVSWWLEASRWAPRVSTNGFTYAGWMPLTTAVFAFAAATALGTIVRRPGWAVAIGLAIMVVVPWFVQNDLRANLVPVHSTTLRESSFTKEGVTVGVPSGEAPADAWLIFNGFVPNHYGTAIPTSSQATTWMEAVNLCPSNVNKPREYNACLTRLRLHDVELYVSDSEYWDLQVREGTLYLAGAAVLLGASLLLVRRITA